MKTTNKCQLLGFTNLPLSSVHIQEHVPSQTYIQLKHPMLTHKTKDTFFNVTDSHFPLYAMAQNFINIIFVTCYKNI